MLLNVTFGTIILAHILSSDWRLPTWTGHLCTCFYHLLLPDLSLRISLESHPQRNYFLLLDLLKLPCHEDLFSLNMRS